MADEPRKGVIVYTENGNLRHENSTDWRADTDNNLNVFEGSDTVATYRNGFWYSVGYERVTKPA